ncbi:hypothetical protein BC833DRAFT_586729 [Globomyces pollinis-pini]|nr:hypothetical protein BC833DRAFT_586729 [Globomyces pollinis-pini]
MFSPFGDIKTIFDLIPKRGLVFITYYDIRAAENAMMGLQNIEFRGRKADIHYSLPKEGDREKNQGSVSVELVGSRSELNNQQLFEYMSRFGEVKVVRDGIAGKKTVSFFDSRACNMALETIPKNDGYADGRLVVALGWDEGHEPAEPMGGGQQKPNYGRQDRGSYGGGAGGRDRHRDMSPRGDDRRMRDRDRDPRRDRDQGRFNDDFRRGRRENSRGFDDDRHGYQQDPYRYDNSPGYGKYR